MVIQDFKVNKVVIKRRLHPHFACKDCHYVKQMWRDEPAFREAVVLNGIRPCQSKVKGRLHDKYAIYELAGEALASNEITLHNVKLTLGKV